MIKKVIPCFTVLDCVVQQSKIPVTITSITDYIYTVSDCVVQQYYIP